MSRANKKRKGLSVVKKRTQALPGSFAFLAMLCIAPYQKPICRLLIDHVKPVSLMYIGNNTMTSILSSTVLAQMPVYYCFLPVLY